MTTDPLTAHGVIEYDDQEQWLTETDDEGATQIVAFQVPRWFGRLVVAALAAQPEPLDDLSAAWAEAEAALPEGWAIDNLTHTAMLDQRWQAEAGSRVGPVVQWNTVRTVLAEGPTTPAALRALAERLREASRG